MLTTPRQPPLKLYLTGLRLHYVDQGLMADPTAFEGPYLQHILRGIKVFHATRETEPRERLPITTSCYVLLLNCIRIHMGAQCSMQHSAWHLLHSSALANSHCQTPIGIESTAYQRNSVQFYPSGPRPDRLHLTLPATKADPFRRAGPPPSTERMSTD